MEGHNTTGGSGLGSRDRILESESRDSGPEPRAPGPEPEMRVALQRAATFVTRASSSSMISANASSGRAPVIIRPLMKKVGVADTP